MVASLATEVHAVPEYVTLLYQLLNDSVVRTNESQNIHPQYSMSYRWTFDTTRVHILRRTYEYCTFNIVVYRT
jgi:hypothetical protein